MTEHTDGLKSEHPGSVGYKQGCPACEHSDPELERELRAFAELMVDVVIEWRKKRKNESAGPGVDNFR